MPHCKEDESVFLHESFVFWNFVWRGDGCGLHEVILWFLGVTEKICVEPPLEYQVFARCGSGH